MVFGGGSDKDRQTRFSPEPTIWVECDCESCPVPDSKRAPVSSGGGPDTTLLRRRSRLLGSVITYTVASVLSGNLVPFLVPTRVSEDAW